LITPLTVYAAFSQTTTVVGNGVRLRNAPKNGTILELMYNGETIKIDPGVIDNIYPTWVYLKRVSTGTIGWMEGSFYDHN